MKTFFKLAITVVLAHGALVMAHPGPRIWVGSDNGAVATFIGDNDTNPTIYTPRRVFIGGADSTTLLPNGQLDEYPSLGTGVYATQFPAYQVRRDGNAGFATGVSIGFNLPGPLLVFDPIDHAFRTTQSRYGDPGPAPQMAESTGANVAVTGAGPVNGFTLFTYNTSGDHGHAVTALYGDGANPVDGPHAVYAVPMKLTVPGLSDSPTYYVMYGRAVPLADQAFQEAFVLGTFIFNAHAGDANLDGTVDTIDFNLLAANFGGSHKGWGQGEFDFNGLVDTVDFNILAANFGASGLPPTNVPEPQAVGMLLMSIAPLVAKRRTSGFDRHARRCAHAGATHVSPSAVFDG